jgi:hypothetical protein
MVCKDTFGGLNLNSFIFQQKSVYQFLRSIYFILIKDQNVLERMVGERAYFEPNWIPGFRQADVMIYILKLTTENGLEG